MSRAGEDRERRVGFLLLLRSLWRRYRGAVSDDALRAQEELRSRDAELSAIFRAFPDLLFELTPDETIVSYRAGRSEDLYVSPEQFLGRRMCDVLPLEAAKVLSAGHQRVLGGERLWTVEYALAVGGADRHFEARIVPLPNDHCIVVVRDVTERHREQEERRELDLRMQEAQRLESLGLLAGGVAHDFNNYLAAILGAAEILSKKLPGGPATTEPLDIIRQAGWRASELSRQLLAYAGHAHLETRNVSLSALVVDTAQLLDAATSKRVRLELDLPDDVPAVLGDVSQLRQVLLNLVTNASEALGDREGHITVRTRGVDHSVTLSVSDDGRGMDAATRQKMFDPFFSTKGRGRGLGLASVLGIVRSHGGRVDVESATDLGTTVRIVLPASGAPAEPLERPRASALPPLQGGVVLVVDDEPGVRVVTARLLREAGLDAIEAADGRAAIALLERGARPDVVVLDMTMPGWSGEETLVELHRIDPSLPVILTSGYDESARHSPAAMPRPPAVFLQNPYRIGALLAAIQSALAERARVR
jgi:two-component system cell cycle sensor histidine kinase/response regulator CckA